MQPLLRGGTGGDSRVPEMPTAWPDHLEAGTQNGPGIAGLAAGVEWLFEHDVGALQARLEALRTQLAEGIRATDGAQLVSYTGQETVPIVTFVAGATSPSEVAGRLDRLGVACRAGLHCAPDAHRLVGTDEEGAVRLSLGWCSTAEDVDIIVRAVARAMAGPVAATDTATEHGHGNE